MSLQERVFAVAARQRGAGKTHVAIGLARWLSNQGYAVAPLHLSTREGDLLGCPGGGAISRAAALLAEACRVPPDPMHDSGWEALATLARSCDFVVAETPLDEASRYAAEVLEVERTPAGPRINGGLLPWFEPGLMPEADPALAGLAPWEFATRPRIAVVSLPHLDGFSLLEHARGAEWLAAPGPGNFDVILVPPTFHAVSDAAWLKESGLEAWLAAQAARGATLVSCEWEAAGARMVSRETLADYRQMSRILGRRLPAPLPGEETYERLAAWFAAWDGLAGFRLRHL